MSSPSHTPIDPTEFSLNYKPSLIHLENGDTMAVANHTFSENGLWVVCRCWDGRMRRFAQHRVNSISDVLFVENDDEQPITRCLAEERLIEEIRMKQTETNAVLSKAEREVSVRA